MQARYGREACDVARVTALDHYGSGPAKQRHFRETVFDQLLSNACSLKLRFLDLMQSILKSLRKEMRNRRRALSPAQQQAHARCVQRMVLSSGILNWSSRIALYFPHDGELDVTPLIERLLESRKRVSVPRIRSATQMEFRQLASDQTLLDNRYGISEPDPSTSRILPLWTHSVIFAPLVAFNDLGYRLGMGGGYYDRAMAATRSQPLRIGLGHEIQYHPQFQHEAWDIPMDAIITEKKIRVFSKRAAVSLRVEENTARGS